MSMLSFDRSFQALFFLCLLMYKFIVFASTRVVYNIMVCKYEVESTWNCIFESKTKSKLIKS
jgi:hypothetical protein